METPENQNLLQELESLRAQLANIEAAQLASLKNLRERITRLENKASSAPAQKAAVTIPTKATTQPPALPPKENLEPSPQKAAITEPVPQPKPPSKTLELDFGKVWFVRIGIVIFLTGLVFAGNYAYQNWIREMSNGARLAALFACSLVLIETGRRLAKKSTLHNFGEVLLAGGMAFFYYCTFAAHHVERLRVLDSPIIAAVLLFAAAAAIAAVSFLRNSKATAILGIVLASYSTMLQPIGWMSCLSSILLGAIGLFFMLRSGWSTPGWASMLGSYGAFLGWQIMGANGQAARLENPATLWFLPPLWIMFATPGMVGKFRASLTPRARAWFTAFNNGLFFLLFSTVWVMKNGEADYWKVAAIFGTLLITMGIVGRRRSETAGSVNLGQGIAVITLAAILKFEGSHLAVLLAFESLALAVSFLKFKGRTEAAFSFLTAIGSAVILLSHYIKGLTFPDTVEIPILSAAITALLIAASSIVTRKATEKTDDVTAHFARISACLLFAASCLIATFQFALRLEEPWSQITTIFLALGLSDASLRLDRKRKMPEIVWGALWFLGISLYLGVTAPNFAALCASVAICIAATWIWHRQPKGTGAFPDLAANPAIPAHAFSFATAGLIYFISTEKLSALQPIFSFNQVAALILIAIAVGLRCHRLTLAATALSAFTLIYLIPPGFTPASSLFIMTGIALASAATLHFARPRLTLSYSRDFSGAYRIIAFIIYCTAWLKFAPDSWQDWLATTSLILTVLSLFLKRKLFPESVALIAVALISFIYVTIGSPWQQIPAPHSWRGLLVVLALLTLILTYRQRPALIGNPQIRKKTISALAGTTAIVTTAWATQMLVWRFGWKPSAVLWTMLGFFFVSTGLWQRLHILRIAGFALLILSLAKLFTVDVWDFNTFLRVVSFIVLGAALILLGLFYNKFADTIKALLDDERDIT